MQGRFVEATLDIEHVGGVRLIGDAIDIIRDRLIETAVKPGIGDVADGVRVQAEDLIRLPEQHVEGTGLVDLGGVFETGIGATAAFDAVPAGELIDPEQIGVVKHQTLRILVRPLADLGLVRAQDQLGDRLDRLGAPRFDIDKRITVLDADRRHGAGKFALSGRLCSWRRPADLAHPARQRRRGAE